MSGCITYQCLVYRDHTGGSLLHSPPSQRQTQGVLERLRNSENKLLQANSVLFADQAVEHRVETAVGVSETHSQGEGVGLGVVEGLAEGHQVKLDQHPPQGESLVRQPADEKGKHDDGDGARDFWAAALASLLVFWTVGGAGRVAHDTPAQDEPQQEEVAHRNDDERN